MSKEFNNFFNLVKSIKSDISISGRYPWQNDCEKNTLKYIIKILKLKNSDNLLDIGCNTGNLSIPLSFFVHKTYGIDNLKFIKKFEDRFRSENLSLLGKNFLDYNNEFNQKFDKILIFSVIQYLKNFDDIINFLNKAINLLSPNGIMYIGDLPNLDKKIQFEKTNKFKLINNQWAKLKSNQNFIEDYQELNKKIKILTLDDKKIDKIIKLIKRKNLKIYKKDQPKNLCMSYTRTDVLIKKSSK